MAQRFFLSLALVFMFAFAQTGAVLHEISHYSESTPTKQQDKTPHSSLCEKCISYGQLAHALDAEPSSLPTVFAVHVLFVPQTYRYTQTSFEAYAARAPPSRLISI